MVTAENMNLDYQRHLRAGWKVKDPEEVKEAKVAAPPKPRIKWCKEGRKIWAEENSRRLREYHSDPEFMKLHGAERKAADLVIIEKVKAEMKVWETVNAEQINAMIEAQG